MKEDYKKHHNITVKPKKELTEKQKTSIELKKKANKFLKQAKSVNTTKQSSNIVPYEKQQENKMKGRVSKIFKKFIDQVEKEEKASKTIQKPFKKHLDKK